MSNNENLRELFVDDLQVTFRAIAQRWAPYLPVNSAAVDATTSTDLSLSRIEELLRISASRSTSRCSVAVQTLPVEIGGPVASAGASTEQLSAALPSPEDGDVEGNADENLSPPPPMQRTVKSLNGSPIALSEEDDGEAQLSYGAGDGGSERMKRASKTIVVVSSDSEDCRLLHHPERPLSCWLLPDDDEQEPLVRLVKYVSSGTSPLLAATNSRNVAVPAMSLTDSVLCDSLNEDSIVEDSIVEDSMVEDSMTELAMTNDGSELVLDCSLFSTLSLPPITDRLIQEMLLIRDNPPPDIDVGLPQSKRARRELEQPSDADEGDDESGDDNDNDGDGCADSDNDNVQISEDVSVLSQPEHGDDDNNKKVNEAKGNDSDSDSSTSDIHPWLSVTQSHRAESFSPAPSPGKKPSSKSVKKRIIESDSDDGSAGSEESGAELDGHVDAIVSSGPMVHSDVSDTDKENEVASHDEQTDDEDDQKDGQQDIGKPRAVKKEGSGTGTAGSHDKDPLLDIKCTDKRKRLKKLKKLMRNRSKAGNKQSSGWGRKARRIVLSSSGSESSSCSSVHSDGDWDIDEADQSASSDASLNLSQPAAPLLRTSQMEPSSDSSDGDAEDEEVAEKPVSQDDRSKAANSDTDDDSNDYSQLGSNLLKQMAQRNAKQALVASSSRANDGQTSGAIDGVTEVLDARAAFREERQRRAEMEQRQKKLNDSSVFRSPDSSHLNSSQHDWSSRRCHTVEFVLDRDPSTDEPRVKVHPRLARKLKPHQKEGIEFAYQNLIGTIEKKDENKMPGCILAHCMGLGKTLTTIGLVDALKRHSHLTGIRRVLVVCPANTRCNWVDECDKWLPDDDVVPVYSPQDRQYKTKSARLEHTDHWWQNGGVLIVSYQSFKSFCWYRPSKKANHAEHRLQEEEEMARRFFKCLVDPGPDMIVCDEGHMLKNDKSDLAIKMFQVKTKRRLVLTGTPMQNNMMEYYVMISFVRQSLLGSKADYIERFANPIRQGQAKDSSAVDVANMRRRSHVLTELLRGTIQRFDVDVMAKALPPKKEYVIKLRLSPCQMQLYKTWLSKIFSGDVDTIKFAAQKNLFKNHKVFYYICNHPLVMFLKDRAIHDGSRRDSDSDDELTPVADCPVVASTSTVREPPWKRADWMWYRAVLDEFKLPGPSTDNGRAHSITNWLRETWCSSEQGAKFCLLGSILDICEHQAEKLLVFSGSLITLDLIELYLNAKAHGRREALKEASFPWKLRRDWSWRKGLDYYRLDGSVSSEERTERVKEFNEPNNERARLFLVSTRAGGLGLNMVGANRAIIFDVSWNPAIDKQAIFRVFRFGQKKNVFIYRLVSYGTMEDRLYGRQITKLSTSLRVVDEQQIDRHYTNDELMQLYKFEGKLISSANAEQNEEHHRFEPPSDMLLRTLLQERSQLIFDYFEHDSLLSHHEEWNLTEDERKNAWDEFYTQDRRAMFGRVGPPTAVASLRMNGPNTLLTDVLGTLFPLGVDLCTRLCNLYGQPATVGSLLVLTKSAIVGDMLANIEQFERANFNFVLASIFSSLELPAEVNIERPDLLASLQERCAMALGKLAMAASTVF